MTFKTSTIKVFCGESCQAQKKHVSARAGLVGLLAPRSQSAVGGDLPSVGRGRPGGGVRRKRPHTLSSPSGQNLLLVSLPLPVCRLGPRRGSAAGAPAGSRQSPPRRPRPLHCLPGLGPCGLFLLLPQERRLGCLLRMRDVTRAWCRTQWLGNAVPASGLWPWCRKEARTDSGGPFAVPCVQHPPRPQPPPASSCSGSSQPCLLPRGPHSLGCFPGPPPPQFAHPTSHPFTPCNSMALGASRVVHASPHQF